MHKIVEPEQDVCPPPASALLKQASVHTRPPLLVAPTVAVVSADAIAGINPRAHFAAAALAGPSLCC